MILGALREANGSVSTAAIFSGVLATGRPCGDRGRPRQRACAETFAYQEWSGMGNVKSAMDTEELNSIRRAGNETGTLACHKRPRTRNREKNCRYIGGIGRPIQAHCSVHVNAVLRRCVTKIAPVHKKSPYGRGQCPGLYGFGLTFRKKMSLGAGGRGSGEENALGTGGTAAKHSQRPALAYRAERG